MHDASCHPSAASFEETISLERRRLARLVTIRRGTQARMNQTEVAHLAVSLFGTPAEVGENVDMMML